MNTGVTVRGGYSARVAVRCTQTLRWSPEGSGVLVCCRASAHSSSSSSSSEWAAPTAEPAGSELEHQRVPRLGCFSFGRLSVAPQEKPDDTSESDEEETKYE